VIVKLRHLRMTAAEIAETLSMPLSTVSAVLTSRLAYAEVLPDERATTAAGFLRRALAFFARYGIRVERVLTDNGSAYVSTIHAITCRTLGIRHLRTRPRRPPNKRESRTLHSHPSHRLGLRRDLPVKHRTHHST
jgi:hypothetical protein